MLFKAVHFKASNSFASDVCTHFTIDSSLFSFSIGYQLDVLSISWQMQANTGSSSVVRVLLFIFTVDSSDAIKLSLAFHWRYSVRLARLSRYSSKMNVRRAIDLRSNSICIANAIFIMGDFYFVVVFSLSLFFLSLSL